MLCVLCVLWLVQLACDVRRLATEDDSALGWPREDVERMSSIKLEDLTAATRLRPGNVWPYYGGVEEVRTVTGYLGELEGQRTVQTSASAKESSY